MNLPLTGSPFSREALRERGFTGFRKVCELENNWKEIPEQKGIYIILRSNPEHPVFIEPGTGGFYNKQEPNVPVVLLHQKWIKAAEVMYIGKAGGIKLDAHLRGRISDYLRFGSGSKAAHYGGRYIWQLSDCRDLVVCWKVLETEEPEVVEGQLMMEFKALNGALPFANIKGPRKNALIVTVG